jgi:hypothetical protein
MTLKTTLGVVFAAAALMAQGPALTFKATASVSAPTKKASVPVTIHIDRFIADADRDKVVAAVKANDHDGTTKTLAGLPDIGYITVNEKKTPIKYAYARATGDGRIITVVTAQPIYFIGGAEKNAKPKAGYDLAMALLVLNGQDKGDGELAPAVKIKVDANGAVVTDDYGTEKVRLVNVAKGE